MPIFEYATETPACERCASPVLEKKLSVFAAQTGAEAAPAPCGTCGHPGGPGSCALN